LKGFSPRIIRIRKITIAITISMWIRPPAILNAKKPRAHNISRTIAIVVNIGFIKRLG